MSEPLVERLVDAADLDGVIDVEAASFFRPTSRDWYVNELARPDVCYIYIVRIEGVRVAGFCALWKIADQIHINNLAIRPELRGRGLGRALLTHVLREAEAMAAPSATLEVRRSNAAALRLYERAGFRVTGVRPSYYTHPVEDALVLWRNTKGQNTGGTDDTAKARRK
jgi:ribosomal-protein-alanine N-acetyltransferase